MLLSEGRRVCAVNRIILSQVEGKEHRKSGLRSLIFLTDVGIESNRNLLPELALVRFTHDSGCHDGGRAGKCVSFPILRMKGSGVGFTQARCTGLGRRFAAEGSPGEGDVRFARLAIKLVWPHDMSRRCA
jgi:hypothetical protein